MRNWTQWWRFYRMDWRFEIACAEEATRECRTLGEAAGLPPRLIADAYLMGGEL